MRIAIISATTFPASLPGDTDAKQGYGSENQNAVLAEALVQKGHDVHFFAPLGSSRIGTFHPLQNTKGQNAQTDLLDHCSLETPNFDHEKLKDFDFIIDGSKSGENIEQLKLYDPKFERYACYRSGYQDFFYPWRLNPEDRHYVTHCNYFKENFEKNGMPADVAHFGVHPFWQPGFDQDRSIWFWDNYRIITHMPVTQHYYVFPHRPSPEKGVDILLQLAKTFPEETFIVSTLTPLPDHQADMKKLKQVATEHELSNIKFVNCPQTREYNFYRRELFRGAKAVLSPFLNVNGYMDTGGLVSLEALGCGTNVIVSYPSNSSGQQTHLLDEESV